MSKKTMEDTRQAASNEQAAKYRELLERMLADARPEAREATLRFSEACNLLGKALAQALSNPEARKAFAESVEKIKPEETQDGE